jgi:hypothetical protein
MMRVLKFVWVTLAPLILPAGHLKLDAGANRDWDIITLAAIGLLGFPGGYIGIGAFGWLCVLLRRFGVEISASHQMYWGGCPVLPADIYNGFLGSRGLDK